MQDNQYIPASHSPDNQLPEERLVASLATSADMIMTSALHTIKNRRREVAALVMGAILGLGAAKFCKELAEQRDWDTQEVQTTSDPIGESLTTVLTAMAKAGEVISSPPQENVLELSEMEITPTNTDLDASESDIPISPTLLSAEAFEEYLEKTSPKPAKTTTCDATHCQLKVSDMTEIDRKNIEAQSRRNTPSADASPKPSHTINKQKISLGTRIAVLQTSTLPGLRRGVCKDATANIVGDTITITCSSRDGSGTKTLDEHGREKVTPFRDRYTYPGAMP